MQSDLNALDDQVGLPHTTVTTNLPRPDRYPRVPPAW